MSQAHLFAPPAADETRLSDVERTLLEAIDRDGPISAGEAGRIVYRLRGWERTLAVPRPWLASAGREALRRLQRRGLVQRGRRCRWQRATERRSGRSAA